MNLLDLAYLAVSIVAVTALWLIVFAGTVTLIAEWWQS